MSEEAKEWFYEDCDIAADELVYVGTWGEYGGFNYNKLAEVLQAYADEQERENLATIAYLRKEIEFL